jgi:hypothetical protein
MPCCNSAICRAADMDIRCVDRILRITVHSSNVRPLSLGTSASRGIWPGIDDTYKGFKPNDSHVICRATYFGIFPASSMSVIDIRADREVQLVSAASALDQCSRCRGGGTRALPASKQRNYFHGRGWRRSGSDGICGYRVRYRSHT